MVQILPGNFGQASIVSVAGSDIAGIHSFGASLVTEFQHPVFEGNVGYTYGRLPVDMSISGFRSISPQSNFELGTTQVPYIQETTGITTGLGYSMNRAFDGQSFSLTYSFARVGASLPFPANPNPYDTPSIPARQNLGTLHLGWTYSNVSSYLWSVSNEVGFAAGVSLDFADPALASDTSGYAATLGLAAYLPMPWLQHHVLALHASGGASGADRAGRGVFYVGGFQDLPVIDVVRNSLIQSGVSLRGYPPVAEFGNYYGLFNAEYRFPILEVDRGPSTLPIFLDRISGAAYVDYGAAFNDPTSAEFKTGVGAELWFDVTIGYILGFTFRVGQAKGLASGGIDKTYFVAAVPF
jgi:outer membrane protein assembly factor BamA